MKNRHFLLAMVLVASGCETSGGGTTSSANMSDGRPAGAMHAPKRSSAEIHAATLAAWKGKKVDDLVVVWGSPTETQPLPRGGVMLSYQSGKAVQGKDLSGLGQFIGLGAASALLDNSATISEYACVVNVKVTPKGIVEYALIARENNPNGEDLCGQVVKPPIA